MKQLIFIVIIFTFYSCNKLDGKTEIRDKNRVYLINSSETKTFKFTLKTTTITNDSLYSYKTEIIELAPGDEIFIGNKNAVSKIEYPDIDITVADTIKLEGDDGTPLKKAILKKYFDQLWGEDTTINGKHIKIRYPIITIKDSLNPYPIEHYKYKYEVTGQVEIKFKTQDAKDKSQ
jgi:hypothetical protein